MLTQTERDSSSRSLCGTLFGAAMLAVMALLLNGCEKPPQPEAPTDEPLAKR